MIVLPPYLGFHFCCTDKAVKFPKAALIELTLTGGQSDFINRRAVSTVGIVKPCALIAVNDELTSEARLVTKEMPRLTYAGKYDPKAIPVLRYATRRSTTVDNYGRSMEPKAMAIHPYGRVFVSVGNPTLKEAAETALAKCNDDQARYGKDGPCFLYATNNDVVLKQRRTTAQ